MTYPIQTERYAVWEDTLQNGVVAITLRPIAMSGLWDHVFSERWYYLWDAGGYPLADTLYALVPHWSEGLARWPGQALECQMAVEYQARPNAWHGERMREGAIAEGWSRPGRSNSISASILTVTMAPLTVRELCSTTKSPSPTS